MVKDGRSQFGFSQCSLEWSMVVEFGLKWDGAGQNCSGRSGSVLIDSGLVRFG